MPANDPVPNVDHIARHCTKQRDFVNEQVTELKPGTFATTDEDPEISVNWLEYYGDTLAVRRDAVCRDMSAERDVRAAHKLALLKVSEVLEIGAGCGFSLDVVHDPYPKNDSHSVIRSVPPDATILHQELADAASQNLESAVPYKKQT